MLEENHPLLDLRSADETLYSYDFTNEGNNIQSIGKTAIPIDTSSRTTPGLKNIMKLAVHNEANTNASLCQLTLSNKLKTCYVVVHETVLN